MKQSTISESWVLEKNRFLQARLPKEVQRLFFPNTDFYSSCLKNPLEGLHYMGRVLFDWLKIDANGCIIDFNDSVFSQGLSSDTAGLYTKIRNEKDEEKEIILINSKYKDAPLAIGDILAHEMMHLYLFRLGLRLEDIQENELLTDLATINTGFPILILNGMSYSSQWWLSIILLFLGLRFWHSEQLSFGYFKPREYGKYALSHFKEKNILVKDVIGYVNPTSRRFLTLIPSFRGKRPNNFIKDLEREHRKSTSVQIFVVAIFIIGVFFP